MTKNKVNSVVGSKGHTVSIDPTCVVKGYNSTEGIEFQYQVRFEKSGAGFKVSSKLNSLKTGQSLYCSSGPS